MTKAVEPTLPKTLRIGHETYRIVNDPKACEAEDANGITVPDERTITIRGDRPTDKVREALLHETLHGCLDASVAGLPVKTEERIVNAITGPLLVALRDNPELVAFLTA